MSRTSLVLRKVTLSLATAAALGFGASQALAKAGRCRCVYY